MNSNQRSQGNNQSDNGGNEKTVSSSRGGTVQKDNMNPAGIGAEQSGAEQSGSEQSGSQRPSEQQGEQRHKQGTSQPDSQVGQESTDRTGSQTGSQQQGQAAQRESNDMAGGYPRSPGAGGKLAADENMDDDTGLSNRANRQSAEDQGSRQESQSNVGRRDDGTPD